MDRRASAHFRVYRINRWSLALVLLALLAILLLPTRGFLPASVPAHRVVAQGVTLLNRDFSGKTEAEARAMLVSMADILQARPVAAAERRMEPDGLTYVVPELNGYSLDVDKTWFRLKVATEGSRVDPVTHIETPPKRIADFPQGIIRQGNSEKKAVALLVNVDWGTPELHDMLTVLKQNGVKATFFVSGNWAEKNRQLLRVMALDGNEIATHGFNLGRGPKELARAGQLKPDLERSVQVIEKITGTKVRYYAPHMSEVSRDVQEASSGLSLRMVLYSLDTVDWKDSTTSEMILGTFRRAKAGDLILLHPKPTTAKVLDRAVKDLHSRGLLTLTLSEVISPDPGLPSEAWHDQHE